MLASQFVQRIIGEDAEPLDPNPPKNLISLSHMAYEVLMDLLIHGSAGCQPIGWDAVVDQGEERTGQVDPVEAASSDEVII